MTPRCGDPIERYGDPIGISVDDFWRYVSEVTPDVQAVATERWPGHRRCFYQMRWLDGTLQFFVDIAEDVWAELNVTPDGEIVVGRSS